METPGASRGQIIEAELATWGAEQSQKIAEIERRIAEKLIEQVALAVKKLRPSHMTAEQLKKLGVHPHATHAKEAIGQWLLKGVVRGEAEFAARYPAWLFPESGTFREYVPDSLKNQDVLDAMSREVREWLKN